jgi:putative membrane protein
MPDFFHLALGTLALRPYVFVFLGVYLLLATWHLGLGRAFIYLIAGYLIAWTSEFCSIHTGFPYGQYIYIPATRGRELWVAGVPFMDSLSYVFLSYASYSLALCLLSPRQPGGDGFRLDESRTQTSGRTLILASLLFVALDVVIDPVALQGYRWFLGQIYGYPEPAAYFGIPLSNFAGWLVVGAIMIRTLQAVTHLGPGNFRDRGRRDFSGRALLGPGLYFGILGFNLAVTFAIGETWQGVAGLAITLPLAAWLGVNLCRKRAV